MMRSVAARLGPTRPAGFLLVCSLLIGTPGAWLAHAQDVAPTAVEPTPTAATIRGAQVAERAQEAARELRQIRTQLARDPSVSEIEEALPALAAQIEQLRHESTAQIGSGMTLQVLNDLKRQWLQLQDQLTTAAQTLTTRTTGFEQAALRLSELEDIWVKADARAHADALPDALRTSIRTTIADIRDVQAHLRSRRDVLLATLGRTTSLQAQAVEALDQLALAEEAIRREVFVINNPPIWTALRGQQHPEATAAVLRAGLIRNWTVLQAYVHGQWQRIVAHGLLLLVMLAVTITLSRRQQLADVTAELDRPVRSVVERPISAALVLTLLLTPRVHPYGPFVLFSLTALLAIVPIMRLFRGRTGRQTRWALVVLTLLLLVSTLQRLLPPLSLAARLLLLLENAGMMAWIGVALRPATVAKLGLTETWRRCVTVMAWVVFTLVFAAFAANLIGSVTFCNLVSRAVLVSALAGIALLTGYRVFRGLLVEIVASRPAQRLHSIAKHAEAVRRRTIAAARAAVVVAWLLTTLDEFALLTPVLAGLRAALAASLTVGALSVSFGSLLTTALILWASFFVARLLRIVLEEDVLSRLSLPRGVPAAISAAVNYVIVLIGVTLALSAAGLDPGRIALVAGALSVGIGFGLQTVVNNFVSGLILLFERPIQIGDVISLGDVTGTVRRIGIRSSTIGTFDGAEVIVPNGTLIAEQVVNWTLTNYQRRIEIRVGVAYGSDPTQVLTLLEGAAQEIADVLKFPAPRALFAGFGDSSLDFLLWVWTDRQDMLAMVRSRVAVGVHSALRQAGIEIPFPQRDVHVKSVDSRLPPADE